MVTTLGSQDRRRHQELVYLIRIQPKKAYLISLDSS